MFRLLFPMLCLSGPLLAQTDSFHLSVCSYFWKNNTQVPGMTFDFSGSNPVLVASDPEGYCSELLFSPASSIDGFCGAATKSTEDYNNGVTVADLLLLRDEIWGVQLLQNTGEKVAADLHPDGFISTYDAFVARNLLLGFQDTLPNHVSWRLVYENYQPFNPADPFAQPCPGFSYQPGAAEGSAAYLAVKMGDIDGDTDPKGHYVVPQDYSVVELLLPDLMLQTGETYEVPVAIKPTWTSRGIQFALRLDTAFLSLDDLIDGQIELQNTGGNPNFRFAPDGTLRILQLFDPTEVLQQGYPLFTCQITALQSGALKDKMQLLTDTLPGILVDFEGKKHPMKPHYYVVSSATLPAAAAQDARIFPNPFSDHTTLSFHLSRPGHV
ncbi:MAG TPA: hypothetical protein PKL15_12560, partial [Saprospiraceae bacterium]|nr:hypothetical protein [Saprospiraceae bacterium]